MNWANRMYCTFKVLLLFVTTTFFTYSCSAAKMVDKAVDKKGAEWVVQYTVTKYNLPQKVTVKVDTVYIKSIDTLDTIITLKDTVTRIIDRNNLKIEYRIRHDTLYLRANCRSDTVIVRQETDRHVDVNVIQGRVLIDKLLAYIKSIFLWTLAILFIAFIVYIALRLTIRFLKF